MRVPMKICTLHELTEWTVSKCPKSLFIGKRSYLRKLREFNAELTNYFWREYRGIPVIYGV